MRGEGELLITSEFEGSVFAFPGKHTGTGTTLNSST